MKFYLLVIVFIACAIMFGCNSATTSSTTNTANKSGDDRLAKASREDKNGWIYLHLEGSPSDIGYQNGYLAANEIDTSIQAIAYLFAHETKEDWNFYRR